MNEKLLLKFKENKTTILIGCVYAFIFLHIAATFASYFIGLYRINAANLNTNLFLWIPLFILPFITWAYSSRQDFYNYHHRKMIFFSLCIGNLCSFFLPFFLKIEIEFLLPLLLKIPISIYITESMLVHLCRFLFFILSFLPAMAIFILCLEFLQREEIRENLLSYRIEHGIDFRKNVAFQYDMHVVRRLENGKEHTIKQQDRMLHTCLDGTTGTGKTSSIMTVAIADDFDQRIKNITYQKTELQKLLQEKKAFLAENFSDCDYNPKFILPTKDAKAKYENILKKAPVAGITVIAPNAKFADEIYELAKARNLKVNRVDPVLLENGEHKSEFIGFNPLYISPNLTPLLRNLEVTKKARVSADVLQTLYEINGKGDPYFMSLNRNVTTCLVILVLLTYNSLHERKKSDPRFKNPFPTFEIIQDILYNFDKANDFILEYEYLTGKYSFDQLGFHKKDYQFVLDLVNNDLLGPSRSTMYEQARGLRTIIDEFLANPLFKQVICCQKSIDMDKMLSEGEITLVNYSLELGRSDATAFGLFFALSFNNAVLRRPVESRIPHFYYIDEFPVLLHPAMEECFTLFRQYNVAMCVAIQTLDQMDKSEMTKYLKGILQGNCATQFIFGRISAMEMEQYEKLGGTKREYAEQTSISETALSKTDTSMSYSVKYTPQDVSVVSGSKMHNLQFQEVTVFTVNHGSPIPAFYGKVNFIKKEKEQGKNTPSFQWEPYFEQKKRAALKFSSGSGEIPEAREPADEEIIYPL